MFSRNHAKTHCIVAEPNNNRLLGNVTGKHLIRNSLLIISRRMTGLSARRTFYKQYCFLIDQLKQFATIFMLYLLLTDKIRGSSELRMLKTSRYDPSMIIGKRWSLHSPKNLHNYINTYARHNKINSIAAYSLCVLSVARSLSPNLYQAKSYFHWKRSFDAFSC